MTLQLETNSLGGVLSCDAYFYSGVLQLFALLQAGLQFMLSFEGPGYYFRLSRRHLFCLFSSVLVLLTHNHNPVRP